MGFLMFLCFVAGIAVVMFHKQIMAKVKAWMGMGNVVSPVQPQPPVVPAAQNQNEPNKQ